MGTERRGGLWMLPRRVPRAHETLDEAARSELVRCTGERTAYLEQLYAWTDPPANERECVLEVAYLSLHPNTGDSEPARAGRAEAAWWTLSQLPRLLPGHGRILEDARQRLSWKLSHTNVAWSLLPAEFSLSDLQLVYEVIQGRPLDKRNFRKWVLGNGLVEATAHVRREGAHRPARLYRFISRQLRVLE